MNFVRIVRMKTRLVSLNRIQVIGVLWTILTGMSLSVTIVENAGQRIKGLGDRAYKLRTRYGLTEAVYQDILKGQDYKCKICGEPHTEENKLHVDHHVNELTGRIWIRGLLCNLCNGSLAFAKHNPELLRASADYLETV